MCFRKEGKARRLYWMNSVYVVPSEGHVARFSYSGFSERVCTGCAARGERLHAVWGRASRGSVSL